MGTLARVHPVVVGDQMVLDHWNATELIRNPRRVRTRSDSRSGGIGA
jgi:hypothetical protein